MSKAMTAKGWKYVLSRKGEILGVFDTAAKAKAVCESHAQAGE